MIEEPNELKDREHDKIKKLIEAQSKIVDYQTIIRLLVIDLESLLDVIEPKFGKMPSHRESIRQAMEVIK